MVALGASVASAYDPWAVQSRVGLTDARLALDSMLMPRPNLSYIDYRSGIMASGDSGGTGGSSHMAMRVQPATSGLAVTVEMGNAVINTPGMGAYQCALDSVKTLTLAASSTTTNRIDLVICRVYDDLNPAIASASGQRKFAVEVWTGDGATATPQRPVPPVAEGWWPLAAVRVNKGAGSVSYEDITDLRGPGLTARGGMRALFGADAKTDSTAYKEPGAYPGDQRWVHANSFQHQVYYGSQEGWRGVNNALHYYANPARGNGMEWRMTSAPSVICQANIPDPGSPYMVYPTGRIEGIHGREVKVEYRIQFGSGALINWVSADYRWNNQHTGAAADRAGIIGIPPVMWGPLTGPTTIQMVGIMQNNAPGYGWGLNTLANLSTLLSVMVYPSTVPPA